MSRVVSWFSCGAASAVATVLAAIKYGDRMEAVYCEVVEEHPDSERFMGDFTDTFGIPVKTIMNEKYNGSIYEVFTKRRFLKGPNGAQCTTLLKKDMRKQYQRPDDIQVFGYTIDEQDRADRFIDANNNVREDFLLIDNRLNKQSCYDLLKMVGLTLPKMYELGYANNNCIGCVKGGMGYWNKIRVDFPDVFLRMAFTERMIGHALNKDKTGPVYLDQLDPSRGNPIKDAPGDCGFTCEVSK